MIHVNEKGEVENVAPPVVVRNLASEIAHVQAVSGEVAIRELRRVQHRTVFVTVPVGAGGLELSARHRARFGREGRRLIVLERKDNAAPFDWQEALSAADLLPVVEDNVGQILSEVPPEPTSKPEPKATPKVDEDEDPPKKRTPKKSRAGAS